jgi:hypothetical protein
MNPEAAEFLAGLDQKISVIAVCGKYRTGKSYLLNKLFLQGKYKAENKATGFQVSPTINPCTKGLWIWKKPLYLNDSDVPTIIIDTEGLGAYDEDENHDAKIFLLALLLCSLLVFNSVGTIDENAISNLSLVINLSKNLQIKSGSKEIDPDELAEYFPSFLWVVRDFSLRLTDPEGNKITSKQYLENALRE